MCSVYECTHLHAMIHWHLRRSEVNPRCQSSPSALSETEFLSFTSTASTTLPSRDSPVSTPIFPQESWEYRAELPHPASCRVWWSKLRPSYFCITNQASFPAPKLSRCPLSLEYMYVRLCVVFYICIHIGVYSREYGHSCATMCTCKPNDNPWYLVLAFHHVWDGNLCSLPKSGWLFLEIPGILWPLHSISAVGLLGLHMHATIPSTVLAACILGIQTLVLGFAGYSVHCAIPSPSSQIFWRDVHIWRTPTKRLKVSQWRRQGEHEKHGIRWWF